MSQDLIKEANKIPFHYLMSGLSNVPTQIRCPFAKEKHVRDDVHKSARYYPDTNRIYCHAEGKIWSPVSLVAQKLGISNLEAAKAILNRAGGRDVGDRKRDSIRNLKNLFVNKRKKFEQFDFLQDILSTRPARIYVADCADIFADWPDPPMNFIRETALALEALVEEIETPGS